MVFYIVLLSRLFFHMFFHISRRELNLGVVCMYMYVSVRDFCVLHVYTYMPINGLDIRHLLLSNFAVYE